MFLLTAVAAGASPGAATFTTMHLILIAILIVLVIAAIVWGARQKRVRAESAREEAMRTEALLAHPQTETAVSPAPPPLGDSGLGAGAAMPQPVVEKPKAATKAAAPAPKAAPAKAAVKPKAAPKPAAKAAPAAKPAAKAAPAAKPVAKAAPTPKPAAPKVAPKPAPKPAAKAVAAKPAAKPKATAPAPAASPYGLIDVKGLGPKAVPLLEAQGVGDLAALAALSSARAAEIDAGLGALSGRMARDKWIEQAKLLAAGDVAAFEATYGKL